MQYRAAAQFSKSSPCTNVPIHCPICPTSVSEAPQTIWKYNALFHLTSEHAIDSTPPKIPRQLLADMHITIEEEEKALKITKEATDAWREEHDIPCTESLLEMIQAEEILYQSKQFLGLVHMKFYVIFQFQPNCGNKFLHEHSHISHDPSGCLIWLRTPMHAPWLLCRG